MHAANGKEYICPNYYKTNSTYPYYCKSFDYDQGDLKEVYNSRTEGKDYFFSEPIFQDEEQLILSREELKKVGQTVRHTGN